MESVIPAESLETVSLAMEETPLMVVVVQQEPLPVGRELRALAMERVAAEVCPQVLMKMAARVPQDS